MQSEMIKVTKFGGSSLSSSEQFEKVGAIIRADAGRRFVVPSAPGKRFSGDFKVTDLLYECYEKAALGQDFEEPFGRIQTRYEGIVEGLGLTLSLEDEFDQIRRSMLHRAGRDYVASRGEYLNGLVLALYLGYDFIDASEVIFFREDGTFDDEKTNDVLSARLRHHKAAVIPGFYGTMPNGTIRTFSRGGSDVTGSIVARAANADLYENWTDVSGFLMADPRIVKDPKVISTITYRELRELSYMGATVLHEDAIFPVRMAGIPINIRNTNEPDAPGTMIVAQAPSDSTGVITGIAGRPGFSVITIEKDMMNAELGFGRRVLEVLEKHKISFEHFPSGIDTMSVVVPSASLEGQRDKVIADICSATEPDSIEIEDGLALIAVVGRNMVKAKGTAARVFTAISRAETNVRMIDQGSCELNIIVGVDEDDFKRTMNAIYEEFEG